MSLLKYLNEQGDEHHGSLFWHGGMDVPFRGNKPPILTHDELERDVEVHHDFHHREFNLSVGDEAEEYQKIMDRAVNGWYYIHFVDRYKHFDEKSGRYIRFAYVEWSQRYGELSPVSPAARLNGYGYPGPAHIQTQNGGILPLAGKQSSAEF